MSLQDYETCKSISDLIETAARKAADFGSEFAGRNWLMDGEDDAKISDVCKETVVKLREAYRVISEAEEALCKIAEAEAPPKRNLVMRMLLIR